MLTDQSQLLRGGRSDRVARPRVRPVGSRGRRPHQPAARVYIFPGPQPGRSSAAAGRLAGCAGCVVHDHRSCIEHSAGIYRGWRVRPDCLSVLSAGSGEYGICHRPVCTGTGRRGARDRAADQSGGQGSRPVRHPQLGRADCVLAVGPAIRRGGARCVSILQRRSARNRSRKAGVVGKMDAGTW